MRFLKYTLIFTLLIGSLPLAHAHTGPSRNSPQKTKNESDKINYRMDCAEATSQTDLAVNNVRARLLVGGDLWWDGEQNGKYVVPKVDPASGQEEVSSIFAGSVWLGGKDDGGNLKVACQTYGDGSQRDFWAGPLDPATGTVEAQVCSDWDKFFRVKGADIDQHLRNYQAALDAGIPYDPDMIPKSIKEWPARGNEFFFELHGFELPNTIQGLAPFHEPTISDGLYNPELGDFPIIQIGRCDDVPPQYPDEMVFWIYNDAGNTHTETQGAAIGMEVQVQAFAYATNDEINDMTFVRYKLINRAAIESINETFFAMWVDPDLGCHTDDYIGCDTSRSLAYVYNSDALDGESGCDDCPQGVATYCDEIPILGIDYFRGPKDTLGNEIGMSSFVYYNNPDQNPLPGTDDPTTAQEYYNYLSGFWRDGTPLTRGGNGYNLGSADYTKYAFPDRPDDPLGWTMCSEALPVGDRRTLQASGPFTLKPGATNELIIGVPWVPNIATYPCPDIRPLLQADDIAQALFDGCFQLTDGPTAPDVDWVELDKEIIAVLSNDEFSNNFQEKYAGIDLRSPPTLPEEDRLYRFEGYKLFQLRGPNISRSEYNDPEKSRLIYQVDLVNEVEEIFNWSAIENPNAGPSDSEEIWVPTSMVQGSNEGIRHTFTITEDQFATADRRLINHRKYYFVAIAYAYNNYEDFLQVGDQLIGQRNPYIEGRRNIRNYTVIPRPIVNKTLHSAYGDGVVITRLDGEGAGGEFLDISDETRLAMVEGTTGGEITYLPGAGPIDIKIYNPLEVVDGEYELRMYDENMTNDKLDEEVNWQLIKLGTNEVIESERTIAELNEQIISKYGFSVGIKQSLEPGSLLEPSNGAIGSTVTFSDINEPWFTAVIDGNPAEGARFNYVKTGLGELNEREDPEEQLSTIGSGLFVPYSLCDYQIFSRNPAYVTPAWMNTFSGIAKQANPLSSLNNVDIVMTADKTKWSRCVVVETASPYYYDPQRGPGLPTEGGAEHLDLRTAPSVGKEDSDGDGLPDEDGDGTGMGWFPGYAVDVETGERLNIFFGENSTYDGTLFPDSYFNRPSGNDMMWNPDDQFNLRASPIDTIYDYIAGGQHFIYVTKLPYDECKSIREWLNLASRFKHLATRHISWTSLPFIQPGYSLNSYADGLIPSDVLIKLRVENGYEVKEGTNVREGYPTYQFKIEGQEATALSTKTEINEALQAINVVPNPYYGYSYYDLSPNSRLVKITNLPAKCTVTIYSLDGKFIRQYTRNEAGVSQLIGRSNPGIQTAQYNPAVEWDLENNKGIPVASGVYLIHVKAPGLGERVIKWFGVARQLETSDL